MAVNHHIPASGFTIMLVIWMIIWIIILIFVYLINGKLDTESFTESVPNVPLSYITFRPHQREKEREREYKLSESQG